MKSIQTIARVTGMLFLIMTVAAGFSVGHVSSTLIVPDNAAATAENIMASRSRRKTI
jgi:hypothetical protein